MVGNPVPVGRQFIPILLFTSFCRFQVVQDFFHQPFESIWLWIAGGRVEACANLVCTRDLQLNLDDLKRVRFLFIYQKVLPDLARMICPYDSIIFSVQISQPHLVPQTNEIEIMLQCVGIFCVEAFTSKY